MALSCYDWLYSYLSVIPHAHGHRSGAATSPTVSLALVFIFLHTEDVVRCWPKHLVSHANRDIFLGVQRNLCWFTPPLRNVFQIVRGNMELWQCRSKVPPGVSLQGRI